MEDGRHNGLLATQLHQYSGVKLFNTEDVLAHLMQTWRYVVWEVATGQLPDCHCIIACAHLHSDRQKTKLALRQICTTDENHAWPCQLGCHDSLIRREPHDKSLLVHHPCWITHLLVATVSGHVVSVCTRKRVPPAASSRYDMACLHSAPEAREAQRPRAMSARVAITRAGNS